MGLPAPVRSECSRNGSQCPPAPDADLTDSKKRALTRGNTGARCWVRIQASATCAGVALFASGDRFEHLDQGLVGGPGLFAEPGQAGWRAGRPHRRRWSCRWCR
jgi:hypothetical protein